jgi:hypothetical protein
MLENLDGQIDTFIQMNRLPQIKRVSVAVNAMAMSPDRSYLPGQNANYSFVIYGQPLGRKYRCLPLHVIAARSGNAMKEVQTLVDEVCTRLTNRGLVVKYPCSDGDAGYNEYHRGFFAEWYPSFLDGGLSSVLHLWKLFCRRVKTIL